MKTYARIGMAMLVASLAVPEAIGQHTQADLDHMPIFGMPADKVDAKGTNGGSVTTRMPEGPHVGSLGIETRGLLEAHGVEVTQVGAGSAASQAGFKIGDIVLDYDGQAVVGKAQLSRLVNETPVGRQVKVGVWRAGARLTLTPTVEASECPPVLISRVEPELTPQARKAGIEGMVSLYAEIGTDGRVYRARVVEGLGYGLDGKAMDAISQWRFNPGRKNGVPVVISATIQVYFRRQQ
jgi:TonB family protein